jgi:lipopolysaccharide export system protein LptA
MIKKVLTRELKDGAIRDSVKGNVKTQRGTYTLSGGSVAITFSDGYGETTNLVVICQSNTSTSQYPSSITVNGFTANGSGSDTGSFLAIGNTK